MIELPEAINLKKQFDKYITGKRVEKVLPPTKPHAFCWFSGDPACYSEILSGHTMTGAESFGMFSELVFDGGLRLCINDGVNPRLSRTETLPKDFQLAICFSDGDALVFTVAMYGGIILHGEEYTEVYYLKSREAVSPFSEDFNTRFHTVLNNGKPTLSVKALIATEQRFPGIGNGAAQDIMFNAGLHPKRKLSTLGEAERTALLTSIKSTLKAMTDMGGRDTEKDIFGNPGGYKTIMSKNSLYTGCPVCGGAVIKEAYLGGSVYYCSACQPLIK